MLSEVRCASPDTIEVGDDASEYQEMRKKLMKLRRENENMKKIISSKENAIEKLKLKHEQNEKEKQARKLPKYLNAPVIHSKTVEDPKSVANYQARTIASLMIQLESAEINRDKLKYELEQIQNEEYVEGLNESLEGRFEHIRELNDEIAEMKEEIKCIDKQVTMTPEKLRHLPSVGKAKEKLGIMDLQSLLYARRDEYLNAFMGELGREFLFLTPLVHNKMTPEDADLCIRAIQEHIARLNGDESEDVLEGHSIEPEGSFEGDGWKEDAAAESAGTTSTTSEEHVSSDSSTSSQSSHSAESASQDKQEKVEADEVVGSSDDSHESEERKEVVENEDKEWEEPKEVEPEHMEMEEEEGAKHVSKCDDNDDIGEQREEVEFDPYQFTRTECADNIIDNLARLLEASHDARRLFDSCKRLRESLVSIYKMLVDQMKALEKALSDSGEEAKIAEKAQEELRRLTERAEAIRKYAEEYQKYSGVVMYID